MPFTPAHAAAIVPIAALVGKRIPLSALVIGTQVPDLPMYLPRFLYFHENHMHSPEGILAGCLPFGLLFCVWFQGFAKEPLVALLPRYIRNRIQPFAKSNLRATTEYFVVTLMGIAIGAATHVFWDSFTHEGRWGYRQIPRMNRIVFQAGDYQLELYKALQYGSTIVFLPLLAALCWWWLRYQVPREDSPQLLSNKHRHFWQVTLLVLPLLAAGSWSTLLYLFWSISFREFAVEAVTTLGLVQFLAVTTFAAWFHRLVPGE